MNLKSKKIVPILVVTLIILVFVISKFRSVESEEYHTVQKSDLSLVIETSGYVEAEDTAELYFEVAAQVTNVFVVEGDEVEQGDILATVSSNSATQVAQYARDTMDIALLDKELFIENYGTNYNGVGGQDEYEIQLRSLEEKVSRANSQYVQAMVNVNKTTLIAPFDGTVSDVSINRGDLSSVLRSAIKLQDVSRPILYTNVSEVDIAGIDQKDKVEIIFDAFPNQTFLGLIDKINPTADVLHGISYYRVTVSPENLPDKLRMGMNASMFIFSEERKNVINLPLFLIENRDEHSGTVELLTSEGTETREIEFGLNNYVNVEVLNGIDEGDRVIYMVE